MKNLDLVYNRLEHCVLYDLLKNKDINQSLAYMVDFNEHKKLKVIPNEYSIEISNDSITLVIILLIGFELKEYESYKNRENVHIISFNKSCKKVIEFKKIKNKIKYINYNALFYTTLSRTNSKKLHDLIHLRNLGVL